MDLEIKMTKVELEFVFKVLGDLPTSTGAYPLLVKLAEQVKEQQNDAE